MKKLLLYTLLPFVASIFGLLTASAQTMPPVQDAVYIYPANPSPTDSVSIIYTYVSGDSCPDYYLAIDSTVANRIYVSKKNIVNTRVICAQIVTKFTTTLNLGILHENTQIYFEGTLINTIQFPCVMDRTGVVVNCNDQLFILETNIYLSTIPRLYIIQNIHASNGTTIILLKVGDSVKFGGYLTPNVTSLTSPCQAIGIATCYEVTSPPPVCVMDKKGVVINCGGVLFIQEYSPVSSFPQLYSIIGKVSLNSNDTVFIGLKAGENVIFGGNSVKIDSLATNMCRTVGVAACYQVVSTPPPCVMNQIGVVTESDNNSTLITEKLTGDIYVINNIALAMGTEVLFKGTKIECFTTPCYNLVDCYQIISTPPCVMDKTGVVVAGVDGCTGKLFIQDISSPNTSIQLYAFGNSIVVNDTVQKGLKVGDKVKFGGYLIRNDSSIVRLCNIAGIATCYQVITTPPECVMDKPGVVVAGVDGCSGQLFIEETTPYMSPVRRLYAIKNIQLLSSTIPIGLKVGDQVKFGGYLIPNDSNTVNPCHIIGIATCYQVIVTPPTCVMDKMGVVVAGLDGCAGKLFIQDTSYPTPQLYTFDNAAMTNSANQLGLKVGDKVKFAGNLITNDSTLNRLCHVVGNATCYELVSSENVYSLSGSVLAGNDLMKSGLAILYKKGDLKATASYIITDGTYTFTNLPTANYTVYVIPTITIYKNYLPTYYISEFLYNNADYLTLSDNISGVVVNLKQFEFPTGTGKISGNIFFESYNLKDSMLLDNGFSKTSNIPVNNSAINTPVILLNRLSVPVAWTMTDSYGNYTFENIALDAYTIVAQTASATGESTISLTPNNSVVNADILLKSSQSDTGTPKIGDSSLRLYPNPVTDNLFIVLSMSGTVDIYNTLGQLLIHQILNKGNNVLDVSTLNKGVFFAKIGETTVRIIKK